MQMKVAAQSISEHFFSSFVTLYSKEERHQYFTAQGYHLLLILFPLIWHETCVVRASAAVGANADMFTRGSVGAESGIRKAYRCYFYCAFEMKKWTTEETIALAKLLGNIQSPSKSANLASQIFSQYNGRVKQTKWTENQFRSLTNWTFEAKLMRYNEMSCIWPSRLCPTAPKCYCSYGSAPS